MDRGGVTEHIWIWGLQMFNERKNGLLRHTWHALEGPKVKEEASLDRMGRVHVYDVMFFLEMSNLSHPQPEGELCKSPLQNLTRCNTLRLWHGRALQFFYGASDTILIIHCRY